MFERYTEDARRVIFFARYEASVFGGPTIETEHLLLGLLRKDKSLISQFSRKYSSAESIRKEIEDRITVRVKVSPISILPLSNECKRILEYAAEEAATVNSREIGIDHLLLGILRVEKCMAAQILQGRGLKLDDARKVKETETERKARQTRFREEELRQREDEPHMSNEMPNDPPDDPLKELQEMQEGISNVMDKVINLFPPEEQVEMRKQAAEQREKLQIEQREAKAREAALQRYTAGTRRVTFFGRYEASQFGSRAIETEHLLLGLIREDAGLTRFLPNHPSAENIRREIEDRITIREKDTPIQILLPLSDECKHVLSYAAEEADRLNHPNIDIEHVLLGILREEKCIAAKVLRGHGLKLDDLREAVRVIETETEREARKARFQEEEWRKRERKLEAALPEEEKQRRRKQSQEQLLKELGEEAYRLDKERAVHVGFLLELYRTGARKDTWLQRVKAEMQANTKFEQAVIEHRKKNGLPPLDPQIL